jgi:carbamoylphosphate synthase large subunit
MLRIHEPCIPSGTANTLEECLLRAAEIGYPVIVRPAFSLGGQAAALRQMKASCGSTLLRVSPPVGCIRSSLNEASRLEGN